MRTTVALLASLACACGRGSGDVVAIDGSSTVFLISEAVAEEFSREHPTRVTVGASGTGGGFKKFCHREIAITGASRPIKAEEVDSCATEGVEYIELPVAYDGLAVVVHAENDWVDHMTVAELAKLWSPEAQDRVERWSDLREDWPTEEIHLFGAGVESGTYDYFTQAIVGKEHASRGDYTSSEDDNVLVHGVATDKLALGFFGYAYYVENSAKLKLVPIDDGVDGNGAGPITPSLQTVRNGTYQPLSRPVFIYVAKAATEKPEVTAFVDFYLARGPALVQEVGYIPLPESAYELVRTRFADRRTGSLFGGKGSKVGVSVEDLLQAG
jgi:phosphate transport system substrate-binding protein